MSANGKQQQIVVIGTGAGGSAAAYALTSSGVRVLALEAGPIFSPEHDYLLDKPHWEKQRFPHKPDSQGSYRFAEMQQLEERWAMLRSWNIISGQNNSGDRRMVSAPGYHHVQGVGGSTLHFTGEAHRMHPESMQMHTRYGVAADWPVSYNELEPFYQQAETIIGVAGTADGGPRWRSQPYPLPPHPLSKASKLLQQGSAKSGFSWVANSRAVLSENYDGRPACNYCNNCNRGCPRRDKGSADVTFMHKALATGKLELRPNSRLLKIVPDANNRIKAVIYLDQDGNERTVNCDILIMAAGAVETPRLLLASAGRLAPNGMANESGQVGLNLMETLAWSSSGIADTPLDSFKGLPADSICWDYNHPTSIPDTIGGCRFSTSMAEADLVGPINYAQRIVPGWGKQHKQALRKAFGQVVTIGAIGEFIPNDKTFVDLDPSEKDRYDMPLARIHSFLPEREITRLKFMMNSCRKILRHAGISGLVEEYGSYDYFSSTHIFGTCRMGLNPSQSVVNGYGQSHTWNNLFITDASIFPSSGGGESPSLTIEALAMRTGYFIAQRLGHKTTAATGTASYSS